MEILWEKDADSDKLYCNTIIFPKKNLIIDPSSGKSRIKEIKEREGWRHCILTHYHGDHRASYYITQPENTYVHENDVPAVETVRGFAKMVGFLNNSIGKTIFESVRSKYHLSDIKNLVHLKDEERLNIDGVSLHVIHTPGHTPGHICLYIENEDTLYLSDIDLTEFGPWYGNVRSDINEFISSIDKVAEIKVSKYLSGHLPYFLSYKEFKRKIKRYKAFFFEREEKILNILNHGPKRLDELAQIGIIYPQKALHKTPTLIFFEKIMLMKHLERLIKDGEVIRTEENSFTRKT